MSWHLVWALIGFAYFLWLCSAMGKQVPLFDRMATDEEIAEMKREAEAYDAALVAVANIDSGSMDERIAEARKIFGDLKRKRAARGPREIHEDWKREQARKTF
jgi:hypothetical protein